MRTIFDFIIKKAFLKYLLAILFLLIIGLTLYLLKSPKNENQVKRKYSKTEIRTILARADFFFDIDRKYSNSYYYYNKAQLLCDTSTDYIDYVYAITCMASIEQLQGNYVASEILLTKTLPYLKKIKKTRFSANVYEQFGANYYYTYDYNNALQYYEKALHLPTSYYRKIKVLNSISQIYIKQKKFKLAESILIKLSKIKTVCENDKKENDYERARILDDLGLCYFAQGKPEALDCYKKSIKIQLQIRDYYALLYSYLHVAEYFEEKSPSIAKSYAKKAYMIATKLNNAPNKLQSLKVLSKISEGNDLKKYSINFIQLADSIAKARQKAKNQFARIKYYSDKDRFENLQLKKQKAENELKAERENNRNIISYITIVVILGGIIFLYFHLKSKGKREKKQAIFESEIRISNQLRNELTKAVYNTLIFAQNEDLEEDNFKEKLLNNLDLIYSKTRNISKENSPIITDKNYSVALKEMISGFKTTELNILLNGLETISFEKIEKNKKIIIYRVLQELLINMQKHSYASLIGISFKKTNKNILVNYTDNGNGTDLQNMSSKNGLQNIENRIFDIKGTIDVDSAPGKGFKVFVKIPL